MGGISMDRKNRSSSKKQWNFWIYELVFCGVITVMFLLMKIIPFFLSIGYAFTDWNGVSGVVKFNGVQYFIRLLCFGNARLRASVPSNQTKVHDGPLSRKCLLMLSLVAPFFPNHLSKTCTRLQILQKTTSFNLLII
jgi:ABC-type sugar transport system permease subunit